MEKSSEYTNVERSDPEEADVIGFLFKLCAFIVIMYIIFSIVGFDTPIITF